MSFLMLETLTVLIEEVFSLTLSQFILLSLQIPKLILYCREYGFLIKVFCILGSMRLDPPEVQGRYDIFNSM